MMKYHKNCDKVSRRYSDGTCVVCKHTYYKKNKEKIQKYASKHYNIEEKKEHNQEYYKNNTERILKQKKEYYDINQEAIVEQKREYIKGYKAKWKAVLINKRYHTCEICGYNKCFVAIEFHHNDTKIKKFNISDFTTRKPPTAENTILLLEEIEKCRILCANCHRELHHSWRKH